MTGGSLGLRTGSYGSLQQQLQNSVSPVQQAILRKPSKMLLPGSREKERFINRILKFAGRRRFGMLLLCIASVVVLLSVLSNVFKDEDTSGIPDKFQPFQELLSNNFTSSHPVSILISGEQGSQMDVNSSLLNSRPVSGGNKDLPPAFFMGYVLPPGNPCENFATPPPPADRKRTGPRPCPVCYLPVEQAIALMPKAPSMSPVLRNLTYVNEETSIRTEPFGGSEFGGYPSLKQRNESFEIKESMHVYCGFVRGSKPGRQTGFDIDDADLFEMEQCHGIVVASAIFGNYDIIQQPKNISEAAKKNVCFYMFVDEETEAYIKNSSSLDSGNRVGLWRIVVVHNLPYPDARRNGKVPKLLLHRIFPNARFSLWIDGKLELVVDPYQVLERFHDVYSFAQGNKDQCVFWFRFLWRQNASFAISRHYRRFDVFEEAEANKAAGKYNNASIDFQVEFYKNEGLMPYSEAKLPITSDVPEGCVIIREHIPVTNLFTCLWFNEVDRFTSRDQISFSTVRDKIMSKVSWSINMFMDCERRNFVVQAYHRDLLEHMAPAVAAVIHPPPALANGLPGESSPEIVRNRVVRNPARRNPTRRGRDKRSSSRRHRKVAAGSRESNSS